MFRSTPSLDVPEEHYEKILFSSPEHQISITDRVDCTFHFVKYHDSQSREEDFLKILRKWSVHYCFPKERYKDADSDIITDLTYEARDKFFNPSDTSKSGELGELALYFLLESFLKAPQIVSKMSLKTTGAKNYNGSDGIHFGKHNGKFCIFYCESKLNKTRSAAFLDCKKSVLDFHENKKDFEISIVKNHIDIEDVDLKEAIIDFLDPSMDRSPEWVEVNACFVGYNWDHLIKLEKDALTEGKSVDELLKEEFQSEIEGVKKYLEDRIKPPEVPQRFLFFIIPFKDVEQLRKDFLKLLYGS